MDTDLSGLQVKLAGRLDQEQHRAFMEMIERSGLDERKRKDLINRLIDHLKGI
jgi:hypothetical protein